MNKSLDILELVLSGIGFITCCLIFLLTRISERYFFYMVAVCLGFNIIAVIKKIEKDNKQPRVIKYSNKIVSSKNIKKVSI